MSIQSPPSSHSQATPSGASSSAIRAAGPDTSSPSTATSPSQSVQDRLLAEFEINPIPDLDHLAAKLELPRKTIRDFFSKRRRALGIDGRVPPHPPPGVQGKAKRSRTIDSADSDYDFRAKRVSSPSTQETVSKTPAQSNHIQESSPDMQGSTNRQEDSLAQVSETNSTHHAASSLQSQTTSSLDAAGRLVNYAIKCGVITKEGKPCTRALTCKVHNLTAKRAVIGRTKPFDTLLVEFLQVKGDLTKERERNAAQTLAPTSRSRRSTSISTRASAAGVSSPSGAAAAAPSSVVPAQVSPASTTKVSISMVQQEPAHIPDNLRIIVPKRTDHIPRFVPPSSSLSDVETPSELNSAATIPRPRAILPANTNLQLGKPMPFGSPLSTLPSPATGSADASASVSLAGQSQALIDNRGRGRGRGRPRGRGRATRGRGGAARRSGRSSSEEGSDDEAGYITGNEEYSASPAAEALTDVHRPARVSHRAAVNKSYREDSDESEMSSSDEENDVKVDVPAAGLVTLASAEPLPIRQPSIPAVPSDAPSPRPTLHPPRAHSSHSTPDAEPTGSGSRPARPAKPPLTYTTTTYHGGGLKLTHFHSTPVQSFWQEAPRPPTSFVEMRYGGR